MKEHAIKQLIEEYIDEETGLGKQTAELKAQIQALEAKIGVGRLELAEQEIEAYARRGVPYDQAFEWVATSLEERERERQARREQARREKVTAELEALDEAQEMRILEQEEDDA